MKWLLVLSVLIFSCGSKGSNPTSNEMDSLVIYADTGTSMEGYLSTHPFVGDTTYLHTAPVKIISAKPHEQEYSNFKSVRLTYKNISDKKIKAIRFKWYGTNAFNEPADMGTFEGYGNGFDDDGLSPGKTKTGRWDILSKDLDKVIKAWPYEVVFSDNTTWKAGKD